METQWVSETSEVFKQLTQLSAREDFIQFSRHESLKTYIINLYREDTNRKIRQQDKLRKKKSKLLSSLAFMLRSRTSR
jgi:uncharacterized FlaG/YvyC family protein